MKDVLDDFLSGDGGRIWRAAGKVMASRDRDGLRALAAEEEAIRAAVVDVGLGGALRPNATHLDFALRKIAFAVSGVCFCALYPTYDMFDPKREAEQGNVRWLWGQSETWTPEDGVQCADCGQIYYVTTQFGEHYATWWWAPAPGA